MISVRVAYDTDADLVRFYNHVMETSPEEWVLFMDHDVYLELNPNWYACCMKAIEKHPDAGWITCRTNLLAKKTAAQRRLCPQHIEHEKRDLVYHEGIAIKLWRRYGTETEVLPIKNLPGFFMLTSRKAWKMVGGFRPHQNAKNSARPHFLGVDNQYSTSLYEMGVPMYMMKGLYVYHGYLRHWKHGFGEPEHRMGTTGHRLHTAWR